MPCYSATIRKLLASPVLTASVLVFALFVVGSPLHGQDNYFVTYSHELETPGTLELSVKNVTGSPRSPNSKDGNTFVASALEFEYGVKTWWTTEIYLDGQSTVGQSTLFTGFRWENRIRPLTGEHWINPVLYFEFADINGADKTLLEVVGHDSTADFLRRNDRSDKKREAELKLILSSNFKGWNVSENMIAEKKLSNAPWEFGYALGASRSLKVTPNVKTCAFCRQDFTLGAELYGGLGDRTSFGLRDTSHYAGPVLTWSIPKGPELRLSPNFGLSDQSNGFLFRFMISYDFEHFGKHCESCESKVDKAIHQQ